MIRKVVTLALGRVFFLALSVAFQMALPWIAMDISGIAAMAAVVWFA